MGKRLGEGKQASTNNDDDDEDDEVERRRERRERHTTMAGLVNEREYVPVNVDHEGYVESENALFKHVAVREREQDSTYTPATANIAPRPKSWAKTESNTQKAHKKIEALEALK